MWTMGPSMVAFLKGVYGRAKEVEKFLMSLFGFLKEVYSRPEEADNFIMSQQPALEHTRKTVVALSFHIFNDPQTGQC